MNIVEVRELVKEYPRFKLDRVSFGIEEGKITGFVGRNGAGKTTTIKAMLNLIHADNGSVFYFGKDLKENEKQIKNDIGYSSGTVNWYPRKKINDIVKVVRDFYPTWDDEAYRKYLEMFSLSEDKCPCELSEGMKVKFNLLLALSHKARVLILDEPTSGLDPFSRDELMEIFKSLAKEGTSIFFSTHIVSDLEKCADDIIYISKGEIINASPIGEFMEKHAESGESLEDAILRLERGRRNE